MQSSHATIVLILAALSVNQITYENALALTIGENIGTTITAVIGSLSSNIDGKRLAGAHFIFNVITATIAVLLMSEMIASVDLISSFMGISNDNYTLKLAVFDSLFKIMGVLIFIPFIDKLVHFLQRTIKSKKKKDGDEFEGAIYLNDSVLELPTTAISALTNETKHLYENAFEIIAHGLNLKREHIISAMPLENIVKHPHSENAIDIDNFYNRRIKGIYGEIIDFSTKAQSHMRPKDIEILYKIKLANRDIVEAVKDTKHLQKNLIKYDKDPNKYIKEQYDNIKIGLAELLRNIDLVSKMTEEDEVILLLSKAKVHMQKYDILANGTLDNLIRHNLITNEMATSLMYVCL
jgi:phosphate:Na+ symporter